MLNMYRMADALLECTFKSGEEEEDAPFDFVTFKVEPALKGPFIL